MVLSEEQWAESPNTRGVTLMGPPKQYLGNSSRDRYAFMVYEAVSLLHRYGFHTNIPLYHPSKRFRNNRMYHQRVPGVLGFLLNDIDPTTRISLFDYTNTLVSYLGFATYEEPWLKVVCVVPESSEAVHCLRQVLSRGFLLAELFHQSVTIALAVGTVENCECKRVKTRDSVTLTMTTGLVPQESGRSKEMEETATKFTFTASDGTVLCRAIWSFSNEALNTIGPSLEDLDVLVKEMDPSILDAMLTAMEDAMTSTFAPMVGFRIRMACSIKHPVALRWMIKRGYTESKETGFGRVKSFAMF